ncbi:hypothetical protein F4805DRAFT_433589 [Annulohypoxylon moriforme]|nr:hypothetical protein F4805DRAFT_433589 [Annulohypoxylon moriforme]
MSRPRTNKDDPVAIIKDRRRQFLRDMNNRHRKLIQRVTAIITTEEEALLTKDEARSCAQFLCTEIRRIERLDTKGKIKTLLELSRMLNNVFNRNTMNRDTMEAQMWWILKRYKLFKSMSSDRQSQYLTELIQWRRIAGKHDGLYLAYFLPGIHIFDYVSPKDQDDASRDKNWFVWWFSSKQNGLLRDECNRMQRILDEDRQFLHKLRPRVGARVDTPIEI